VGGISLEAKDEESLSYKRNKHILETKVGERERERERERDFSL